MLGSLDSAFPLTGMTPTSLVLLIFGSLVYLAYLYQTYFPKPLPGIPYNSVSAKRLFGDTPEIRKYYASGGFRRFYGDHQRKLKTPISQIFMFPYKKPFIVLTDIREINDISSRRYREFDRSKRSTHIFGVITRDFHLAMQTSNPKFKGNKEIVRDLMTPTFLNTVSAPHIYNIAISLMSMWRQKMGRAKNRPFPAYKNLHHTALDVILAASFGIGNSHGVTNMQDHYLEGNTRVFFLKEKDVDIADFPEETIPEEYQAIMDVTATVSIGMKSPFPYLHHWFIRNTSMRRTFSLKETLVDREIQKGVDRLTGRNKKEVEDCAMDRMILREQVAAEKQGRAPDFFQPRIRDELFGYIAAGHDTSSATMSWMVKFLADYQEPQARLRRQLRAAYPGAYFEGRQPTVGEITKCHAPYLDAWIEEALRIAQTVPMGLRETIVDTTILGHFVPKGTSVFLYESYPQYYHGPAGQVEPAYSIPESLRSEGERMSKDSISQWDPETIGLFQPERWLKRRSHPVTQSELAGQPSEFADLEYDSTAGPFFTFGGGPRGCFGRKLAYLEMRIVVAILVWNFDFATCPPELSSYKGINKATTVPEQCFVKLNKAY